MIIVHEFGHYLAARMLGISVERLSLGFGKPILKIKYGKTEYCIAPILLGGYSRIPAMRIGRKADTNVTLPAWKKVFILISGPVANLLFGILIFLCLYLILKYTKAEGFLRYIEGISAKLDKHSSGLCFSANGWLENVKQILLMLGTINFLSSFFNILPLPLLDGGNIIFASIEGISGKQLSAQVRMVYIIIGIMLLTGVTLFFFIEGFLKLIK